MPESSIAKWICGVRAGDSAAVQTLWDAYFVKLVRLARSKLAGVPRVAADEEDIALSAFKSFCVRAEQGQFPQLNDETDLWSLLVRITARKAVDRRRYESRTKRGGTRSLDAQQLEAIIGREPTPEFAAQVAEEFQARLKQLPEDLRDLAVAKSEGFTTEELAQKHACAPRTIERRLQLIRRIWSDGESEAC